MPRLAIRLCILALGLALAAPSLAGGERYKKLYEEAYVIKKSNPEAAKAKLRWVIKNAPGDSVYLQKAANLLRKIELSPSKPADTGDEEAPVSPLPAGALKASSGDKAKGKDLRKKATRQYKAGKLKLALENYQLALEHNPRDHELHRLIGSVNARLGNRKAAYRAYKTYVQVCPKCMYTPSVKKILEDYETLSID